MFRWLGRRKRSDQYYRDYIMAQIEAHLHDISETLERIEAHNFSIVNAVEADK